MVHIPVEYLCRISCTLVRVISKNLKLGGYRQMFVEGGGVNMCEAKIVIKKH